MNRAAPTHGLILTGNVTVGNQVAALLKHNGWQTEVVCSDREAYRTIQNKKVGVIITDIESPDIGGLAVMIWCKTYHPSMTPYAICRRGQRHLMQLARDLGGCAGYFYLMEDRPLQIDTGHGMAARLTDKHTYRKATPPDVKYETK